MDWVLYVSEYQILQCFRPFFLLKQRDTSDQGTRTLATGYATPGGQGSMTVALCAAVCGQNNQKYAGMEYGGECCT